MNDKILHFLSFCIASGVFYFIFDADECVLSMILYDGTGLIHGFPQGCAENMVLEVFWTVFDDIFLYVLRWYFN